MTDREKETDGDRPFVLLHQLAGHIVDRGDMIGIDRMAQAETIGEDGGAQ